MRKLFSILFLNAWGGVRRTISLLAAGAVVLGVSILVIATHVDFDASSHTLPVSKTATAAQEVAVSPQLGAFGSVTAPKTDPKQSQQVVAQGQNPSPADQSTTQQPKQPTLTLGQMLVCTQASGALQFSMQSAKLTLPSPPAVDETVGWYWDIEATNGNDTTTTQQNGTTQTISAGNTTVTIPGDGTQLLNFMGDGTSTYRFRLHIVGSVSITSDWTAVSQNDTDTCQ